MVSRVGAPALGHGLLTVPRGPTEGLLGLRGRGDLRSRPGARSGDRAPTWGPNLGQETVPQPGSPSLALRAKLRFPFERLRSMSVLRALLVFALVASAASAAELKTLKGESLKGELVSISDKE